MLFRSVTGTAGNGNTVLVTLPFSQQSGSLYWIAGSVGHWSGLSSTVYGLFCEADAGTTIRLRKMPSASTGTTDLVGSDMTSSTFIAVSLTYPTSS